MDASQLLALWLDMLVKAGTPDFRKAQDYFTNCYKRYKDEQGNFHALLAADHKRWAIEQGLA